MTQQYTPEELAEMSGEASYRAPRALELNEVLLNGDAEILEKSDGTFEKKGGYFRKRILVGRLNRDEKPEEINLGSTVSVIFLKIRRKLVERADKGEIVRSTNEHTHKNEAVNLYDSRTKERVTGIAATLRTKYEGLRTVQIVYALLLDGTKELELVRVVVKGSALGSEAKAEGVTDFYRYIGGFPKEEHIWQFETLLVATPEQGAKRYFTIDFQKGRALDGELQQLALAKLKEVHEKCVELDQARMVKIAAADVPAEPAIEAEPDTEPEDETGSESATDDINPDDIPF